MKPVRRNIRKELDLKIKENDSFGKMVDKMIVEHSILSRRNSKSRKSSREALYKNVNIEEISHSVSFHSKITKQT